MRNISDPRFRTKVINYLTKYRSLTHLKTLEVVKVKNLGLDVLYVYEIYDGERDITLSMLDDMLAIKTIFGFGMMITIDNDLKRPCYYIY